jgi:PLP dependent protein
VSAIADQLAIVRERMAKACKRAGRSVDSVQLIAVSKLHPASAIRECHRAGQVDFGENYAQDLRDKAAELAPLEDLRWHAIGPLQINKAKYVAKSAHAFHALDKFDVAQELSKRRIGNPLRCYVEVNIARESSKHGLKPADVEQLIASIRHFDQLQIVGLMCLPPMATDPESARPYFRELRNLSEQLQLSELSMGTTADFEVAIEEGATAIRVGTAIFGARTRPS